MPLEKTGSPEPFRLCCCVSHWDCCSIRIISCSSVLPAPRYWRQVWLYYAEMPLTRSLTVDQHGWDHHFPGVIFLSHPPTGFDGEPGWLFWLIWKPTSVIFFQFMFPLPLAFYLLWRWGRLLWTRSGLSGAPEEKFILFLSLIVLGNILILTPAPQCELRYLVHLYPLCAIILGWIVCQAWRYQKFSGVLLAVLLLGTNWLNICCPWIGCGS